MAPEPVDRVPQVDFILDPSGLDDTPYIPFRIRQTPVAILDAQAARTPREHVAYLEDWPRMEQQIMRDTALPACPISAVKDMARGKFVELAAFLVTETEYTAASDVNNAANKARFAITSESQFFQALLKCMSCVKYVYEHREEEYQHHFNNCATYLSGNIPVGSVVAYDREVRQMVVGNVALTLFRSFDTSQTRHIVLQALVHKPRIVHINNHGQNSSSIKDQACHRLNNGKCTAETCSNGRKPVCGECGKDHRRPNCPTWRAKRASAAKGEDAATE